MDDRIAVLPVQQDYIYPLFDLPGPDSSSTTNPSYAPSAWANAIPRVIDFTMCNPPWYTSPADLLTSTAQKHQPPPSISTASASELFHPGGEVAFVQQMMRESLLLHRSGRYDIRWHTTMLGRHTSIAPLVSQLRKLESEGAFGGNYALVEFVQGERTRRWGLGWSFGPWRPKAPAIRMESGWFSRSLLPSTTEEVLLVSKQSGLRCLSRKSSLKLS